MDPPMILRKKIPNQNESKIQNNNMNTNGKQIVDDIGDIIIKKNKSLDKEQITKLITFRGTQKLDQKMLANKLNISYLEIKDAELGKEIKPKTYNLICNWLNKT